MTPTERTRKLVSCARAGNLDGLKEMLAEGADINAQGENGNTALFNAAFQGHLDCVQFLLENKALIDGRNARGSTALMGAAEQGRYAVVEALLACGADKSLKNSPGQSALGYAQNASQHDIVRLLRGEIKPAMQRAPVFAPLEPRGTEKEISYSYPLDNRVLQEVFNFERRERISMIRRDAGGMVEAMARESFDDLTDKSALRRAFDDYRSRGGKIEEADVFTRPVPKPKLSASLLPK
jgi:hypothetical protein